MSFRNKLAVSRCGLNNFDNTVDSHYICSFCFRRISISKSTFHNTRCQKRQIHCSSSESETSSESESSSYDFSYSKDVEEEIQEHQDVPKDGEEEVPEDVEIQNEEIKKQGNLPIDIDEDDEKEAETVPEEKQRNAEISEKNNEKQDQEKMKGQEKIKRKSPSKTRHMYTIVKKMRIVESWNKNQGIKKIEWCRRQNIDKSMLNKWIKK